MRFYRLSYSRRGKPYLPLHWSYAKAWEWDYDEGAWEDLRARGAQVTDRASWIAEAVLGAELDGYYDDYPWILVIDAAEYQDSAGAWYAVVPEDVLQVRVVRASNLRRWLRTWAETDLVQEYDLESDEQRIASWLDRNALLATVPLVETLPKPRR